jgi:phosphoglycolate phosphatase-like HAD superfamily hydrolase
VAAGVVRLLVLWDVDHTLIETRGLGTQLYRRAFERVTGVPVCHDVDVTGRTEQAIFAEALRRHGIAWDGGLNDQYAVELASQYQQHRDELRKRGRRLPGASEAVARVANEPHVVQSVLTGNVREVALVKLEVFDLDTHLDLNIGAYGDDASERAELVPVARRRAYAKYGRTFGRTNTVLIGDTVGDVTAARRGGARIIAIASGRDNEAALRSAGAEVVLPSLRDSDAVVEALTHDVQRTGSTDERRSDDREV